MERETWTGKLDFILSCMGYAVGLGNVWRFPYLTYKNGGGAFLIPYITSLLLLGMPLFFLELSLGQFTSLGPSNCWDFCLLIQGCGISMTAVSFLTAIYYNVILAWAFFYMFASFKTVLPWLTCGDWSTKYCSDKIRLLTPNECAAENGTVHRGLCSTSKDEIWIVDQKEARMNGIKIAFATQEYFEQVVTGSAKGNISNLGSMHWQMVLCLMCAWILVAACLIKGIKSSGKVVYVTSTVPYLLLFLFLARGLALDGSRNGIEFYLTPDFGNLKNAKIWKDAAVQIFFSLSTAYGGLITLASYNKFSNDILRDSLFVSIVNSLTSILAGFVIFTYIGFMANNLHLPVDEVAKGGPAFVFGVYPFCLTKLPYSSLWSVIFFMMIILLGIDSQFVLVETVITSIIDRNPKLRTNKYKTVLLVCFIMFLFGLPMTTNGAVDILTILDTYAGGWNVLVIAIVECIAISWIYGVDRFIQDINTMIGGCYCSYLYFGHGCQFWWKSCWAFFTPAMSLAVVVYNLLEYSSLEEMPWWVDIIGWSITTFCVGIIIVYGVYNIIMAPGHGHEKFRYVTTPTKFWGPALIENRHLVKIYIPDLILNPFNNYTLPMEGAVKESLQEISYRTKNENIVSAEKGSKSYPSIFGTEGAFTKQTGETEIL